MDEYVDDDGLMGVIRISDSLPLPRNTPFIPMIVVHYTLTQLAVDDNILRTSIFYTYIKISDKMCKTIVNNNS